MIFIDANILIDLIEENQRWADWSESQLRAARQAGPLVINVVVYAEVARTFPSAATLDAFLADSGITVAPIPAAAAYAASVAHRAYRLAGGARTATLPDFFIGAHAQAEGHTLLTRDASRIRTYFPSVPLICPE